MKDLKEAIEEEFSDASRLSNEWFGLHAINPEGDPEARKNYQRWYHKFVRYPKHKQELLLKHKEWREENAAYVKEYWRRYYAANAARKIAYEKKRKEELRKTPEGRKKLREWAKVTSKRYIEKVRKDPEKYKKLLESGRKRSKAYRERLKAKKMSQWQNDRQSYLNQNEPQSDAA